MLEPVNEEPKLNSLPLKPLFTTGFWRSLIETRWLGNERERVLSEREFPERCVRVILKEMRRREWFGKIGSRE